MNRILNNICIIKDAYMSLYAQYRCVDPKDRHKVRKDAVLSMTGVVLLAPVFVLTHKEGGKLWS